MDKKKDYGILLNIIGGLSAMEAAHITMKLLKMIDRSSSLINAGGRMLIAAYVGMYIGGKIVRKASSIREALEIE